MGAPVSAPAQAADFDPHPRPDRAPRTNAGGPSQARTPLSFDQLGLTPEALRAVAPPGSTTPTPIPPGGPRPPPGPPDGPRQAGRLRPAAPPVPPHDTGGAPPRGRAPGPAT